MVKLINNRRTSARPRRRFAERSWRSQAADLRRQAKVVAPATILSDTDKKLQERWFLHPNWLDYEGIDTRSVLTEVNAGQVRPGDIYFDKDEGLVTIKRVHPISPKQPDAIKVTTTKGVRTLTTTRKLHVNRPVGEIPYGLEKGVILPESPITPEAEAIDDDVRTTELRRVEGEGPELPEELQAEGISPIPTRRRPRRVARPEGDLSPAVRGESGRVGGPPGGRLAQGDLLEDTGDRGRLTEEPEPLVPEPLVPELPPTPPPLLAQDIRLTSPDDVNAGASAAKRFDDNLDAIRTLKQVESENRPATTEEQRVIARFSGFGDSAFNPAFREAWGRDDAWERRGTLLRELTTEDEYQSLERGRINAFYTTPEIVSATWAGLETLGASKLSHPAVLEPSAGSGRFLGYQPEELASRSRRTAIDLDELSGRMLKKLYPNADVHVMGYEKTPLANDSVDIAISNVPFGNIPVYDPEYQKGTKRLLSRQVHNYFFSKTLDKLRPGGVLAFITSHHTLDAPSATPIREALSERADLLGAIRLPKSAFPDTQVVTDIIYLRKRLPGEAPTDTSWVGVETIDLKNPQEPWQPPVALPLNRYFVDHPEMVLGTHSAAGSMYRGEGEYTLELAEAGTLIPRLQQAVQQLPRDVLTDEPTIDATPRVATLPSALNVHDGTYVIDDSGNLLIKEGGNLNPANLSPADTQRAIAMMGVRDAARVVLATQLRESPTEEVENAQRNLTKAYDDYVRDNGPLNTVQNVRLMGNDPDGPFLRALEQWDTLAEKKLRNPQEMERLTPEQIALLKMQVQLKNATSLPDDTVGLFKMPIFTKRVVRGLGDRAADSPSDAVAISLNEKARLDFDRMGILLNKDPDTVRADMAKDRLIFKSPKGDWEPADQYLVGDVRAKLREAEEAALTDPTYLANVAELQKVQPPDLTPSQIEVRLGIPWIPASDVNDFVTALLAVPSYTRTGYKGRWGRSPMLTGEYYRYNPTTGEWFHEEDVQGNHARMTSTYGTNEMPADKIIARLLEGKPIEVKTKGDDGKPTRDPKATIAAQEKADVIQAAFKDWVWEDSERADRLSRTYNETYNAIRPKSFDGEHLAFPGMSTRWYNMLHPHQKDAIWRVVQDGTTLLAHEVGFGKTAVMVGAGMELRRLGLSRKNIFVVPKATHAQFMGQFRDIYPYAKVLFPGEKDFTPAQRPEFLARAATGDWDAIILSDTQFKTIPLRPETESAFLKEEINTLRSSLTDEAREFGSGSKTHKEMQKVLVRAESKLQEVQGRLKEHREHVIHFEDLGVDQLFVDEADRYKNLQFTTRMGRIKGLPDSKSDRAWDMYQKARVLQNQTGGRGVVFATGTPIANTIAEMYTMMRYLQGPMLEAKGIQNFDAWARTFGATTNAVEQTTTGQFKPTQRFAKFFNTPELSNLWQMAADIKVASEEPSLVKIRPRMVDEQGNEGKRIIVSVAPSQAQLDFMQHIVHRAENLKKVDPKEDNMLKISNDARMAALDARLVDPSAPSNPSGKIATAVRKIADVHRETTSERGTQLVFLDIGTPKAKETVSDEQPEGDEDLTGHEAKLLRDVYGDLKQGLVNSGIPEKDIAFIHDVKTNKARERLFENVNRGHTRILIGSTEKMGAGVNVQERAAALHHLDAPWRPRDIEQREGRVVRQGNIVYGPKRDENGDIVDPGIGVKVYNYVTERSFDAYMWQTLEAKAKAIKSIMKRDPVARSVEDMDEFTMSAGEAKAIATGNPDVMRSVQLRNDVLRLQLLKSSHLDAVTTARREMRNLPNIIEAKQHAIQQLGQDSGLLQKEQPFSITVKGTTFTERPKAGDALIQAIKASPPVAVPQDAPTIGQYRGFALKVLDLGPTVGYKLVASSPSGYDHVTASIPYQELNAQGVVQRIHNKLADIPNALQQMKVDVERNQASLQTYGERADSKFNQESQLDAFSRELSEVETRLQGLIA